MIYQLAILCVLVLATSSQPPGAGTDSDTEYEDLLWRMVPAINLLNLGEFYLIPIQIVNATSQVAAGTIRRVTVLVGESTCERNEMNISEVTKDGCPRKDGGNRALDLVVVFTQVFLNKETIVATKIRDVGADEKF